MKLTAPDSPREATIEGGRSQPGNWIDTVPGDLAAVAGGLALSWRSLSRTPRVREASDERIVPERPTLAGPRIADHGVEFAHGGILAQRQHAVAPGVEPAKTAGEVEIVTALEQRSPGATKEDPFLVVSVGIGGRCDDGAASRHGRAPDFLG